MPGDAPKPEAEANTPRSAASSAKATAAKGKPAAASKLILSSSPHLATDESVPRIMYTVVIALLPASLFAVYLFGWDAVRVLGLSVAGCILAEWLVARITGIDYDHKDGSAAVTGMLLALNLPASAPWWLILVGALVAVALGKAVFGGLGQNPFNPALVARVFLLISWPVQMTHWPVPRPLFFAPAGGAVDGVTSATPLGLYKEQLLLTGGAGEAASLDLLDPFLGTVGGSLGEMSVIALVIGAIPLLYKRYITWHIPVSFIGTVGLLATAVWLIDPARSLHPLLHLGSGGLFLGALFMATDMVTSPMTKRGMLLFGAGCGLITIVIRLWGGYPEGVSFAILIMNGFVPLIDRYLKPKPFGGHPPAAAGAGASR
jgi:electron transport complex protein RnfD